MQHTIELQGKIYEVDDEFLSDILTTAAEGGINYWADIIRYETGENPAHTQAVILVEDDPGLEGAEGPEFTIDINRIKLGIERIIAVPPVNESKSNILATYYQKWTWLTDAVKNPQEDNVMIDADVADMVVQFGLFGEEVYG